jgi:hypothetical protein
MILLTDATRSGLADGDCPLCLKQQAGARAFRQAIDAVIQGVKVSDYAEENEFREHSYMLQDEATKVL